MALFSAKSPSTRPKRLKIGFVDHLLTRPLVRGIEQLGGRVDVEGHPNEEVATALAKGDLDVALVSSMEVLKHPEYTILPTVCVGTFGGSGVAVLCSKVLPTEIQTVVLDGNAQVVVPLVEVLLPRQVMIRPQLVQGDASMDEGSYDFVSDPEQAFLLTGVGALKLQRGDFFWTWDVLQAWKAYVSLPFVLWVWAVRPRVDLLGLDGELNSLLVGNLSRIDEMAEEESQRTGIEKDLFKTLYRKSMHYTLDNLFMAGLRRFAKEACDAGLVPGQAPIRAYTSK